ncbi:hypothetical protein P8452_73228 [Trifolium repens]|nr:hypothetical protein P8452_73228 [Trifolium repens]
MHTPKENYAGKRLCPCADCYNRKRFTRDVVRDHLIAFGFQKGYDIYLGSTWENYTNLVKTVGSLKGNGILASLRHALLSMIPCRA